VEEREVLERRRRVGDSSPKTTRLAASCDSSSRSASSSEPVSFRSAAVPDMARIDKRVVRPELAQERRERRLAQRPRLRAGAERAQLRARLWRVFATSRASSPKSAIGRRGTSRSIAVTIRVASEEARRVAPSSRGTR
jgi:hypothetical protein